MATNYQISPRKAAENKISRANISIWLVIIITVINTAVSIFGESDSFSGLSLFTSAFAFMFYRSALINIALPIGAAAISCIVFALCAVFGKKHPAAHIVAAAVWGLDTLFMAFCLITKIVTVDSGLSSTIGVAFHIWILYDIISGIISAYKLKKMPPESETAPKTPFREDYGDVSAQAGQAAEPAETSEAAESSQPSGANAPAEEKVLAVKPLYEADGEGETRFDGVYSGLRVCVKRKFGLTELIIDGQVYDRYDRIIEEAYTLGADVSGVQVIYSQSADGSAVLSVNGETAGKAKFDV